MSHIKTFTIVLALAAAPAAFSAGSMDGMDMKPAGQAKQAPKPVAAQIRKIDIDSGQVTLRHGAIDNLGMGAMTMSFTVKDKASLKNFKEGDAVLATFDMVDGKPTVMEMRHR